MERVQNRNLIPPKPGERRNPNGKPKGSKWSLLAVIRNRLKNHPTENILAFLKTRGVDPAEIERLAKQPAGKGVAEVLTAAMLAGNTQAILGYIARTEEPPKQALEITGPAVNLLALDRSASIDFLRRLHGQDALPGSDLDLLEAPMEDGEDESDAEPVEPAASEPSQQVAPEPEPIPIPAPAERAPVPARRKPGRPRKVRQSPDTL